MAGAACSLSLSEDRFSVTLCPGHARGNRQDDTVRPRLWQKMLSFHTAWCVDLQFIRLACFGREREQAHALVDAGFQVVMQGPHSVGDDVALLINDLPLELS